MLRRLSWYTLGGIANAGLNFGFAILLTHYLERAELGVLSLYVTYVSILTPLIGLAAASVVNVDFFRMPNKKDFAELVSSVQFIPIIPFLSSLIFAWMTYDYLSGSLELEEVGLFWWMLMPVSAMSSIYAESLLAVSYTHLTLPTTPYV